MTDWAWDETLFAGAAPHYTVGRMPYPPELAAVIRDELGLDGRGRLLDVGCGPGSLTLLLAPLFEAAVGVDPDPGMLAEAGRLGGAVTWRQLRGEDLPAGLGTFRVVTFAQSFHWMDRPAVARAVRDMIEPGGAWVHVAPNPDPDPDPSDDDPLPRPAPPWDAVDALVAEYLGPVRRAGRGFRPQGTKRQEEDVMRAAGYAGPVRLTAGGGEVAERSVDELVSAVFSLSSSAPHLFGDRLPAFGAQLRGLLEDAADDGWFAERRQATEAVVWRP